MVGTTQLEAHVEQNPIRNNCFLCTSRGESLSVLSGLKRSLEKESWLDLGLITWFGKDDNYHRERRKELMVTLMRTRQQCILLKDITEINKDLVCLWSIQPESRKHDSFKMPELRDGNLTEWSHNQRE